MKFRWRKKRKELEIELEKLHDIKEQSKRDLERTKKTTAEIYKIVQRGRELQSRNHFMEDIERALGGLWK